MRALIAAFAIPLLSGCAATNNPHSASPAPIAKPAAYSGPAWYRVAASDEQKSFAQEKVAYSLKDPSSAQFRSLYALSRGMGDDTVCGEVNAKNGYGGYVGFRMFYVRNDGNIQIESTDDILGKLPKLVCDKPPKPLN